MGDGSCIWCQEFFISQHPLDPSKELGRRSERSQECRICYVFIGEEYTAECADQKSKKHFQRELCSDNAKRDTLKVRRTAWIDRRQAHGRGRPKKGASPRRSLLRPRRTIGKKKIVGKERMQTEERVRMGVFWPKQIYSQLIGGKIPRRQLQKRNGIVGVVKPHSFYKVNGYPYVPDGCVEMFKKDINELEKATYLYDEDDHDDAESSGSEAIRDDASAALWKKGKEMFNVTPKVTGSGEKQKVRLVASAAARGSDDTSIFKNVWGELAAMTFADSSSSGSDDDSGKKPRRGDTSITSSLSKKAKVGASKSTSLHQGRQVCLDSRKYLEGFSCPSFLQKLRPGTHMKMRERVSSAILALSAVPGEERAGVDVSLNEVLQDLMTMDKVAQCLENDGTTCRELTEAVGECAGKVPVDKACTTKIALKRNLIHCLDDMAFPCAAAVIDARPDEEQSGFHNTSFCKEEFRADVQSDLISVALEHLAHGGHGDGDSHKNCIGQITDFVQNIDMARIEHKPMFSALLYLKTALDSNSKEHELSELAESITQLSKKSVQNPLKRFLGTAVGKEILVTATGVHLRRCTDDAVLMELRTIQPPAPYDGDTPLPNGCWKEGKPLPGIQKWKNYRNSIKACLAKASAEFPEIHHLDLEAMRLPQLESVGYISSFTLLSITSEVRPVLTKALAHINAEVDGKSVGDVVATKTALMQHAGSIPSADALGMKVFECNTDCQAFDKSLDEIRQLLEATGFACDLVGKPNKENIEIPDSISSWFRCDPFVSYTAFAVDAVVTELRSKMKMLCRQHELARLDAKLLKWPCKDMLLTCLKELDQVDDDTRGNLFDHSAEDCDIDFRNLEYHGKNTGAFAKGFVVSIWPDFFGDECADVSVKPCGSNDEYKLMDVLALTLLLPSFGLQFKDSFDLAGWEMHCKSLAAHIHHIAEVKNLMDALHDNTNWKKCKAYGFIEQTESQLTSDSSSALKRLLKDLQKTIGIADKIVERSPLADAVDEFEKEPIVKTRAKFLFQTICCSEAAFAFIKHFPNVESVLHACRTASSILPAATEEWQKGFLAVESKSLKLLALHNLLQAAVTLWRTLEGSENRSTICAALRNRIAEKHISPTVYSLLKNAADGRGTYIKADKDKS